MKKLPSVFWQTSARISVLHWDYGLSAMHRLFKYRKSVLLEKQHGKLRGIRDLVSELFKRVGGVGKNEKIADDIDKLVGILA